MKYAMIERIGHRLKLLYATAAPENGDRTSPIGSSAEEVLNGGYEMVDVGTSG